MIKSGECKKCEAPGINICEVRHVGRSTRFFSHTIGPAPVGRRSEECEHVVDQMQCLQAWEPNIEIGMKIKWNSQR